MTAEVAIMNKDAVALAADSAVTMTRKGEQEKIFTSVNKLFALSKYCPVGIMVFGRADFMDVPWETIIKIYREKLGKQKFDTLEKYAKNFIAFLGNRNPLFPEKQQERRVYGSVRGYFEHQIKDSINEKVNSIIREKGKITERESKQIISDVIKQYYDHLEGLDMLPSIPRHHIGDILKKYGNIINKAKEEIFEKLPISKTCVNQLRKIAADLFSKDVFPLNTPGVVIAGFGEDETFPALKSFNVEGIFGNILKYKETNSHKISFDTISLIIPFAQREMVYGFMEGIDPTLERYMQLGLLSLLDGYPEVIVGSIKKLSEKEKRALLKKLKKASRGIFRNYQDRIKQFRAKRYSNPVTEVVAMLPKDELAKMAESLVSLTSFKRKVTPEAETVAGPIDVAVISKGDGFIWIKRKHYFKGELNPQFFGRYSLKGE